MQIVEINIKLTDNKQNTPATLQKYLQLQFLVWYSVPTYVINETE